MNQRPRFRLSLIALALLPLGAQAQQAAGDKPEAKDATKLEAVVVSATKRLQPLQKTPIAVSVIGGGSLEEMNLNNLTNITAQLPTVNYRANASNKDSALFIRGVGTISTSPGVEPTVSMVMDGVVTARPGQATMDLIEVERIEILRGPQGTLFGKNSSAGAINIVTRAPKTGFGGFVDLSANQRRREPRTPGRAWRQQGGQGLAVGDVGQVRRQRHQCVRRQQGERLRPPGRARSRGSGAHEPTSR